MLSHLGSKRLWRFMTMRTGDPIRFVFNNSTGCRAPCPNGRAHVCQICLGTQRVIEPAALQHHDAEGVALEARHFNL
eukprot:3234588-Amphidinium_carterae.1